MCEKACPGLTSRQGTLPPRWFAKWPAPRRWTVTSLRSARMSGSTSLQNSWRRLPCPTLTMRHNLHRLARDYSMLALAPAWHMMAFGTFIRNFIVCYGQNLGHVYWIEASSREIGATNQHQAEQPTEAYGTSWDGARDYDEYSIQAADKNIRDWTNWMADWSISGWSAPHPHAHQQSTAADNVLQGNRWQRNSRHAHSNKGGPSSSATWNARSSSHSRRSSRDLLYLIGPSLRLSTATMAS